MIVDAWGEPVSGTADSVACWDRAWAKMLHFRGDPMTELETANRDDRAFVLGPVFNAAYYVLSGTPPDAAALRCEVERIDQRTDAAGERDQTHVKALRHLLVGDYTRAAEVWDGIAGRAHDFAALRIAHDVYLHIGDAEGRLRSSQAAADRWQSDDHGYGFVQDSLLSHLRRSADSTRQNESGGQRSISTRRTCGLAMLWLTFTKPQTTSRALWISSMEVMLYGTTRMRYRLISGGIWRSDSFR